MDVYLIALITGFVTIFAFLYSIKKDNQEVRKELYDFKNEVHKDNQEIRKELYNFRDEVRKENNEIKIAINNLQNNFDIADVRRSVFQSQIDFEKQRPQ